MAYADFDIRWVPADTADSDTDYEIWSDVATPNDFQLVATQDATLNPGGAAYTAISTTLSGAHTATDTTIVLAAYTNIAADDLVSIDDKENVYLGAASGPFTGCTRGWGDSIAVAHADGVAVYLAHESYTYTLPFLEDNSDRHLIRVQVRRRQGLDYSIMQQTLPVYPTPPANTVLCTVYGVETDGQDEPMAGLSVTYTLAAADTYVARTGENIVKKILTTTTDASGYWEFQLHKTSAVVGSVAATITATYTGEPAQPKSTYAVASVPDQNFAHIRECM